MKRPHTLIVFATLALIVLSAPVPRAETAPAVTTGGTLTIATDLEAYLVDPQLASGGEDQQVLEQIFDRLFFYDDKSNLQPLLAREWKNVDPVTWLITIRSGVQFHNGREMVAEDVKYSYERLMDPNVKAARRRLSMMDKVEAVDKYTVKVTLKKPYPPFLHVLTLPQTAIVPKEEVARLGDKFNREPVGSGPFKLVEWRAGDRIVLEKNPDYWLKKPNLDRVVFRFIVEPSVQLLELQSGGVDIIHVVPPDELARLKRNPGIAISTNPGGQLTFLGFNVAKDTAAAKRTSPMGNPLLRKAMFHAVDWDQVAKAVLVHPEYGSRSYGLMPSSMPFYTANLKNLVLPYDKEKARALLKQAGHSNGFQTSVHVWNKPHERAALVIQGFLRDVGIDFKVNFMTLNAWIADVNGGDFDSYIRQVTGMADPDEFIFDQFHSANFGSRGNRSRYFNTAVDQLIEKGQVEMDPAKRLKLYMGAQNIILKDVVQIPVYSTNRVVAYNRRVQDLLNQPQQTWFLTTPLNNLWIRR